MANSLEFVSTEDQRKLAIALAELKSRGLPIPASLRQRGQQQWPVDENGFFSKADGRHFKLTYTDDDGTVHEAVGKRDFISSTSRFCALVGGRGSGKSGSGAQKALRKIMQGQSGAVINPDFENFRYSTWPEFREWIPWHMVIPSQRNRRSAAWQPRQPFVMVFLNGAKVYCKGLKDPDSARGPNLNWLWYDEGSRDLSGMAWNIAIASVRVGDNPQAWVTFTPRGMEHWTYKFFVKQEMDEEILKLIPEGQKLVEIFFTSILENKDNLDPLYYIGLMATYPTGYLRDQELYGKFVAEGGVLGDPAWFTGKYLGADENGNIKYLDAETKIKKRIRYWDLAATEKDAKNTDPDSSVGTLVSWDGKDAYFIENQVAGQWKWETINQRIVEVAEMDGANVEIWIEQEPGSGGKNQIDAIAALPGLSGYTVKKHKPVGDKVERANLWFAKAALGKVYLVKDVWNKEFLAQLSSFPGKGHDDRIDCVSGGLYILNPPKKWKRIKFLSIGGSENKAKQIDSSKPVPVRVPGILKL
jgi:predicted phage terminase large subunit-like protein